MIILSMGSHRMERKREKKGTTKKKCTLQFIDGLCKICSIPWLNAVFYNATCIHIIYPVAWILHDEYATWLNESSFDSTEWERDGKKWSTQEKWRWEKKKKMKWNSILYKSNAICNECATLIGSLHDRSSEDAFRMLVCTL